MTVRVRITTPSFDKIKSGEAKREVLRQIGFYAQKQVKKGISEKTMGNPYTARTRAGTTVRRIAGKIGEPPNSQTGTLLSSIEIESGMAKVSVGTSIGYGKHLEEGLHPFLAPVARDNKDEITKLAERAYLAFINR